jgi:hypothetical protein
MAQKLSHRLTAAEQRIADLEAEVERHRDRAERAAQWLHKVYAEIELPPATNNGAVTRRHFKFFSGGVFQSAHVPRNPELLADYRHLQSVQ